MASRHVARETGSNTFVTKGRVQQPQNRADDQQLQRHQPRVAHAAVRPCPEDLGQPFVVHPRSITVKRVGIDLVNAAIAQDIGAEPHMSPEVRIGAREGDDDEKRGPYRDPKNRFGWSGRNKTTLEETHHGPGKNLSSESAASTTRAFASGN